MQRILPTPNDASIVIILLPRIIYTLPIFRPKFPGVPFGVDLCCLLLVSVERKKPKLISHENIFEVFQPMRPRIHDTSVTSTSHADGRTDWRTICRSNTALCV